MHHAEFRRLWADGEIQSLVRFHDQGLCFDALPPSLRAIPTMSSTVGSAFSMLVSVAMLALMGAATAFGLRRILREYWLVVPVTLFTLYAFAYLVLTTRWTNRLRRELILEHAASDAEYFAKLVRVAAIEVRESSVPKPAEGSSMT